MSRDPALIAESRALKRALDTFPTLAALRASSDWPALDARLERVLSMVRCASPRGAPRPPRDPARLKAVHWNIEHGNRYPEVESALATHPDLREADLVLLNEVDLGMARSGNRDVAADLGEALGLYSAWTPLFLECTSGRDEDPGRAAGRQNEEALFGLALLSRYPLGAVRAIELSRSTALQFDVERMYGRYVALIAEIERPGAPFVAVSTHLEVHRTRARRAQQMRVLLGALDGEQRPVALGGDFNSHTFDRGLRLSPLAGAAVLLLLPGGALAERLVRPDRGPAREPLFDHLRGAGFEWERFCDGAPTLQLRFERLGEVRALPPPLRSAGRRVLAWAERRARLRLDWFAGRGWHGGRGFTVRGLDGPGQASDHAPLAAEFV
ncbi:MAG TPA: endonuclease/exonuclease/phosphatase family protein [Candidatus Eisenbacteria bacterium]|jgi:endonuclease/exonuclease/phosphatase family metal-dependent hydrolase